MKKHENKMCKKWYILGFFYIENNFLTFLLIKSFIAGVSLAIIPAFVFGMVLLFPNLSLTVDLQAGVIPIDVMITWLKKS